MENYPIDQPTILPSPSEEIWKKFEYFDRKAEEHPEYGQYDRIRWGLLDLWSEQYQKEHKEYKAQGRLFKKGGEK